MQAAATVIPFPPLRRLRASGGPVDDLELTPADLASPAEARAADTGHARLDPVGWEANLLLAVPLFVSPGAGGATDVLAILTAMLAFGLVGAVGPMAPTLRGRPGAGWLAAAAVGAALVATAAVGAGLALALVLFALLEPCRHALGNRRGWPGPLLLAAGLVLRLDAGAVALGIELAPGMVAAGSALALFVALALRRAEPPHLEAATGRPKPPNAWPDLTLLALAAGVVTLYAAALLGDPRIEEAAGVWPLLTVPLVGASLFLLWPAARGDRVVRAVGPDRRLAALGAAWAGLLTILLSST